MATMTLDYLMNIQVYADGVTNTAIDWTMTNFKTVPIVGTGNPFLITFSDSINYNLPNDALPNNGNYYTVSTQFLVMQGTSIIGGRGIETIHVRNRNGTVWSKYATQRPEVTVCLELAEGVTYNLVINHTKNYGGGANMTAPSGQLFTADSGDRTITVTELNR